MAQKSFFLFYLRLETLKGKPSLMLIEDEFQSIGSKHSA